MENLNLLLLNPFTRYSLLKKELRTILLEKDQDGYKSRYFYVSLQKMQKVITELEEKYGLTSVYTEERRGANIYANRSLYDVLTGNHILETEIEITNLKEIKDFYGIEKDVLMISEPRDATNTLLLEYYEPQYYGSISTYFQRYTYNQLYDFQETTEDDIEKRGRLQDQPINKEPAQETPRAKRAADDAAEIRSKIKKEFDREFIKTTLGDRKLATMDLETALKFYEELVVNKPTATKEEATTKEE